MTHTPRERAEAVAQALVKNFGLIDWRARTDIVELVCRHCGGRSVAHRVYASDTGAKWDIQQEGLHETVHEAIQGQPEADALNSDGE